MWLSIKHTHTHTHTQRLQTGETFFWQTITLCDVSFNLVVAEEATPRIEEHRYYLSRFKEWVIRKEQRSRLNCWPAQRNERPRFVLRPVFQIGEKRGLVGCHQRSCGRKSHVSEWQSRESWYKAVILKLCGVALQMGRARRDWEGEMWRRVQTIHGSAPKRRALKRRAPQFSGAQPPGCSHRTSVFPSRQTWRWNRRCRARGAADDNSTIEWGWEEAPGCSWRYLARRFRFRCEPAVMFWKDVQCNAGFTPDAEAQRQAHRSKESQAPPIHPHVKPLCRLHQRRFSAQRQGASRLVAIFSASSLFFPLAASLSRHETHLKLILNDINDIFYMI